MARGAQDQELFAARPGKVAASSDIALAFSADASRGGPPERAPEAQSAAQPTDDSGASRPTPAPDTLDVVGSESLPVEAKGDGQVVMRTTQQVAQAEGIESILARSWRNELVEKKGPEIKRYMPTEDPNAFLLPESRLRPEEHKWQRVFVALPWGVFACMLATPFLLVHFNMPLLKEKADKERKIAEDRNAALSSTARVPEFTVVTFGQVPDVLERPVPTLLLLFDPHTFASQLFLPFMRDIEAAFRKAGLNVAVAAVDLTANPGPSEDFGREYPRALSPHLQVVLPRASDGEAGVIDYRGRWSATSLTEAAYDAAGPMCPEVDAEDLKRIEANFGLFRASLFDLLFAEESAISRDRPPWWKRLFVGRLAAEATASERLEDRRMAATSRLDLSSGLEVALESTGAALALLREPALPA